MNMLFKTLVRTQIVPVLTLPSVDAGLRLVELLYTSKFNVAEITLRTPCALEAIDAISRRFPEVVVIAGTVLTADQVEQARDVGVQGIVIPGFSETVVEKSLELSLAVCPAVVTPSEVLRCLEYPLEVLKFFPAEAAGGTSMLKAMASVFPRVQFMPTGGINKVNVQDYLSLDNVLCCGGSWLAPEKDLVSGNWKIIEDNIFDLMQLLQD